MGITITRPGEPGVIPISPEYMKKPPSTMDRHQALAARGEDFTNQKDLRVHRYEGEFYVAWMDIQTMLSPQDRTSVQQVLARIRE